MRLATYRAHDGPRPAVVQGDQLIDVAGLVGESLGSSMLALIEAGMDGLSRLRQTLAGADVDALARQGIVHPMATAELLAPIPRPRKNIVCLGRNYVEHALETSIARNGQGDVPDAPIFFTKAPTSIIGPFDPIVVDPLVSAQMDWEVELGVVLGRGGKNIAAERAMDYVFGYTVINDVTARDLQARHRQWFKGKSLDGTCPMGPWIACSDEILDPQALNLRLTVNGVVKQSSNTRLLIFGLREIIATLSLGLTLEAGDIIATGTPAGVGFTRQPPEYLQPGDLVEAEVEGIGRLRNPVVLQEK